MDCSPRECATFHIRLAGEPKPHLWVFLTDFDHDGKAFAVNITTVRQTWGGGADLEIAPGTTLTEGVTNTYTTSETSYLVPEFWICVTRDKATQTCPPHTYRGQLSAHWFNQLWNLACKYVDEVNEADVQKVIDKLCGN